MQTDELLSDAQRMAAIVAPELTARPLYILGEHPKSLPVPNALGYATTPTPLAIRDELLAAGKWRGQGSCIVLIPDQIAAEAQEQDSPLFTFERVFNRTVVHELAHCLPAGLPIPDLAPTTEGRDLQAARFAMFAADANPPAETPWEGHGIDFIRRCIHLINRAWSAGFDVAGGYLCADALYGLSPVIRYAQALGDEPERMAGRTFAEIEATDPSADFLTLFNRDVAAWHARQTKPEVAAA